MRQNEASTRKRSLSITFDDCFERTVRRVLPLLDEFDIRATFYASPNLVGGEMAGMRVADWSLLEEVVERGHEIGSHTMNHTPLPTTSLAQLRRFIGAVSTYGLDRSFLARSLREGVTYACGLLADGPKDSEFDRRIELDESRRILEAQLRTTVRSFAYPGGVNSRRAIEMVTSSAYTSARGTVPGCNVLHEDSYDLHSYAWGTFSDVAEMNALVDRGPPGWIIHTFHAVTTEDRPLYTYTTAPAELESHLRHLVDATDVEILPVGEVVARNDAVARGDDTRLETGHR